MSTTAQIQSPREADDNRKKPDPSLTERRSKEHAVLSSLIKKTQDPEVGFEEFESHLRYLFASAKHFHDWKVVRELSK